MAHLPIEDPSEQTSFVEQTTAYVRASPLLRLVLIVTLADHIAALLLVVFGRMPVALAGFLALLSVLSWFFAVGLPVMNREVRTRVGLDSGYWGEVVEMFSRVVLCALTGLHTALLIRYVG